MMKEIKTHSGLVVARPGLLRDGLQAVLSAISGMSALEPADDGTSALNKLESHHLDLVILGSNLTADELNATLRQIKEQYPDVRCIIVAASPQQGRALKDSSADAVLVEGVPAALFSTTIKDLLAQP
jgi:DNA-binding NarL/FixJ family response regulator